MNWANCAIAPASKCSIHWLRNFTWSIQDHVESGRHVWNRNCRSEETDRRNEPGRARCRSPQAAECSWIRTHARTVSTSIGPTKEQHRWDRSPATANLWKRCGEPLLSNQRGDWRPFRLLLLLQKIALLRRRLGDLEDELRIYKGETQRLSSEINRVNNDIHCEKLLRAACESEKASADNELDCLRQMCKARPLTTNFGWFSFDLDEEELTEIRSKNMITSSEPSNLFKRRLVSAIQQIRSEYESSIGSFRQSLKLRYKVLTDQHSTVSILIQSNDADVVLKTRLHEEWLSIRNSNEHLRARNRMAENSLSDAKQRLAELVERGNTTLGFAFDEEKHRSLSVFRTIGASQIRARAADSHCATRDCRTRLPWSSILASDLGRRNHPVPTTTLR